MGYQKFDARGATNLSELYALLRQVCGVHIQEYQSHVRGEHVVVGTLIDPILFFVVPIVGDGQAIESKCSNSATKQATPEGNNLMPQDIDCNSKKTTVVFF